MIPAVLVGAAALALTTVPAWGDQADARSRDDSQLAQAQLAVTPACTRSVVFLYHSFDRGGGSLASTSRQLDHHLTWLEQNRVTTVSMRQFVSFLRDSEPLPDRVAMITIDDGDETVYTRAWPILRQHRTPFVLGLPTRLMESGRRGMLTWDQVREMVGSGLAEVASHGHEHRGLVHYGPAQAARELSLSTEILRERTGQTPQAFFYPLGAVSARAEQYVREAGFVVAFGAQGAPIVRAGLDPYRIPRVTVMSRHDVRGLAWFYGPKFWASAKWPSADGCATSPPRALRRNPARS